jgi:hypothetical protein
MMTGMRQVGASGAAMAPPLVSGAIALALLSAGMAPWAWPGVGLAVIMLAVSAVGRWPAAGTLFSCCLIGLALAQHGTTTLTYAAVGLVLVIYLLLLDARESSLPLGGLPGLAPQLSIQVAGAAAGQLAVFVGLSLPAGGGLVLVAGASGAAATMFWWLAQAGTETAIRPTTRRREL